MGCTFAVAIVAVAYMSIITFIGVYHQHLCAAATSYPKSRTCGDPVCGAEENTQIGSPRAHRICGRKKEGPCKPEGLFSKLIAQAIITTPLWDCLCCDHIGINLLKSVLAA